MHDWAQYLQIVYVRLSNVFEFGQLERRIWILFLPLSGIQTVDLSLRSGRSICRHRSITASSTDGAWPLSFGALSLSGTARDSVP